MSHWSWHGDDKALRATRLAIRAAKRARGHEQEAAAILHAAAEHHRWAVRILVAAVVLGLVLGAVAARASAVMVDELQAWHSGPGPVQRHETPPESSVWPEEGSRGAGSVPTTTEAPTTTTHTHRVVRPVPGGPPAPASGDVLERIAQCESGGDYTAENPRSSASGKYQFLASTWHDGGYAERYGVAHASEATPEQQEEAARELYAASGTRPWNASKHCWGR